MTIRCISIFLLLSVLGACTTNKQLRTESIQTDCLWGKHDCRNAIIERYLEYDLGFIEFTERGNLYDRNAVQRVFDLIEQEAESERGVAVFVFVHGWKHNARYDDSNVVQFREFLSRAAENEVVGKRKVVGVYLGWRGAMTNLPALKETTYWARKSVAEEVGAGGATEIFTKLHQLLVVRPKPISNVASGHDNSKLKSTISVKQNITGQYSPSPTSNELSKNSYVIIGHSFGGAIVLSALHDVLLKDLLAANPSIAGTPQLCNKINRFADALILLNPAIEANKGVLLKEAAARCIFDENQPPLLHVLSSDGDNATRVFFPIGEYANIASPLSPKKLTREVGNKTIVLDERALSLTTVGNLEQFRTGYLSFDRRKQSWNLDECIDGLDACGITRTKQQANHFSAHKHDPLKFIKTDRVFIKDHNDAFGCYVQGFVSSLILKTQFIENRAIMRAQAEASRLGEVIRGCTTANSSEFDFMKCFNRQIDDYDCAVP